MEGHWAWAQTCPLWYDYNIPTYHVMHSPARVRWSIVGFCGFHNVELMIHKRTGDFISVCGYITSHSKLILLRNGCQCNWLRLVVVVQHCTNPYSPAYCRDENDPRKKNTENNILVPKALITNAKGVCLGGGGGPSPKKILKNRCSVVHSGAICALSWVILVDEFFYNILPYFE